MSDSSEAFADAQQRVNAVKNPLGNDKLLALYGLYKQATAGDAGAKRPGAFDFRGRAKYDAWKSHSGKSSDDAMDTYISLVDSIVASQS